ncbi:M42 family metallopeptidase [Elusimicrobiota bacterium]
MELLKKLCETPGPSGREEKVCEVIISDLKAHVDQINVDALGNMIAFKKGNGGPKVMLSAHMDEIGFLVNFIDENGFLRFTTVGGFDPRTLVAQRVVVHASDREFYGVIGTKPIHVMDDDEKGKPVKIKDLFIDIGLSEKEVKKHVSIGDPVTIDRTCVDIGNDKLTAKAFDNRVGVYVMMEAVKKVKKHQADIYAVASVQEEVGLRGAIVSSHGIEPDIGVALDTTIACDIPSVAAHEYVTKLGNGVGITIMDAAAIGNIKLVKFMKTLAQKNKIKHQLKILAKGGTDAGAMQRSRRGIPVTTLSIPTRYVHSSVEMVSKEDIKNAISLVTAFLENAHKF